jgi:hypothetical protein
MARTLVPWLTVFGLVLALSALARSPQGSHPALASTTGPAVLVSETPAIDPVPIRRQFLSADQFKPMNDGDPQGVFHLLKKTDFESRVSQAAEALIASRTPPSLIRAVYRGTYTRNAISGTAEWSIANPSGRPSPLLLDVLKIAVGPATDADGRSVTLFRGKLNGRALSETYLTVEESGASVVSLPWSIRGVEEPDAERFEFGVPSSAIAVLELTLPADRIPTSPTQRVSISGPFPAQTADHRIWKIMFGGESGFTLAVRNRSVKPTPLVETCTAKYEISPEEIRATFEITRECQSAVTPDPVYTVDPGIRVTSVRGEPVSAWSFEAGKLTVRLREPNPTVRLTVNATLPLPSGTTPWTFPGVRTANGEFDPTSIETTIHPDLSFEGWDSGDYRLTVPGIQPDRSLKFLFQGTIAQGEQRRLPAIRLRTREFSLSTDETVEWRVDPGPMRLVLRLKVKAIRGPLDSVSIQIDPGYVLDSASLTTDDTLVSFGKQSPNVWVLELHRAIATGQVAEFRLDFRGPPGPRASDPSDSAPASVSLPLPRIRVLGATERQGTYSVSVGNGFRIVDRTVPSANVSSTSGFVISYRGREPDGDAIVTPLRPEVVVNRLAVSSSRNSVTVNLHARSGDTPLNRLTVFLPSPGTVTCAGSTATRLNVAERLPLLGARSGWQAIGAAGLATREEELWQITFANPLRGPFTLNTTYEAKSPVPNQPWPIALPVLAGCEPSEPVIDLAPALAEQFRLPPSNLVNGRLTLLPLDSPLPFPPPSSPRWQFSGLDLHTRVEDDGGLSCSLTGRVLALAGRIVPVELPESAKLESVTVDGKWCSIAEPSTSRVEVPMPTLNSDGIPFVIRYRLPAVTTRFVSECQSPLPSLPDEPLIASHWTFSSEHLPWPSLTRMPNLFAPTSTRTFVVGIAVLNAIGIVLAAITAIFGLRMIRQGGPRASLVMIVVVLLTGGVLWFASEGWLLILRPVFATGVVVLVGVRLIRSQASHSRSLVATALLGSLMGFPSIADPNEPTVVYVFGEKDSLMVAAPKTLLAKLNALSASPLPTVVLVHAEYVGSVSEMGSTAVFDAKYILHSHQDGQQSFTFPLSGAKWERAVLNGQPAFPDVAKADRYTVLVTGRGRHELQVRFTVPVTANGQSREASFDGPEVPSSRVEFHTGPYGTQPDVDTRRGEQTVRKDAKGSIGMADHGGGRSYRVRWRVASEGKPQIVSLKEAAIWDVRDSNPFVTAALVYRIENGQSDILGIEVPEELTPVHIRAIAARGTGIQSWTVGPVQNGWARVSVQLPKPTDGRVTLVLRAVPSRPLSSSAVLRFPRSAAVAAPDRDCTFGLRFAGVTVSQVALSGAIDYPPDTLTKDFPALPEFLLDRLPPARVVRQSTKASAEVHLTLTPAFEPIAATVETVYTLGRWAEIDGAIQLTGKAIDHFEFPVPVGCDIRDIRAAGLGGWSRSGNRIQMWFRQPTPDVIVRWMGTARITGDTTELPLPQLTGRPIGIDSQVVRVRTAEGYQVSPLATEGWVLRTSPRTGEWTYTVPPDRVHAKFRVSPLPDPVPRATDPEVPKPVRPTPATPRPRSTLELASPPPNRSTDLHSGWYSAAWLFAALIVLALGRYGDPRWLPECLIGLALLAATALGIRTPLGLLLGGLTAVGIGIRLYRFARYR